MTLTPLTHLKNFVTSNIAGGQQDFVPKADAGEAQATKIDQEYSQIQDGLKQQHDQLAAVDQDSQLRPPALKNYKNWELVAGGALAGAALGGAAGLGKEMLTAVASNPHVDITSTQHDIFRTELRHVKQPWTENTTELKDANGSINGWKHVYTASFDQKKVGTYTTRTAEVKGGGHGNPLLSGLGGMVIGGALGAGVGAAVMLSRNFIPDGKYQAYERHKTSGDGKIMLKFGVAGGAMGAGAGLLSAALESRHDQTVTYQTQTPEMHNQVVGQIPGQHVVANSNGTFQTQWNESIYGTSANNPGRVNVTVNNPVQSGLFHHAQVQTHNVKVDVAGRYGYLTGMLGGMAVGVGAGVATGVLVNVIRKTI